jgi:ureidoacrylate peracid hydrolase
VCVETTARQSFLRDYYVVFTSDCTATYNQADHDAALRNIDAYFGEVVTAAAVRACWQAAPARLRAVT